MDVAPDASKAPAPPQLSMNGLRLAAGVWTLAVVLAAAWLIDHGIANQRRAQLDAARYRLDSLHDSLEVSFRQLAALPRALSRQSTIPQFLEATQVAGSERLSVTDRQRVRELLSPQPAVRQISLTLLNTATDFGLTQIYLMDRHGTTLADSAIDTANNLIGGNYRGRQYYTESLDNGSGTQFAVGSVTKVPGFYFGARVGSIEQPLGVLVVKQETEALSHLFDDPSRTLFVTDANGVILLGNQVADRLGHVTLQGPQNLGHEGLRKLYLREPNELGWSVDSLDVKGEAVVLVGRDHGRYMALSRALSYGRLTAWALVPLEGEGSIIGAWSSGAMLLLLSGYSALIGRAQRQQRLDALTRAQATLTSMAHALPLTVFRYEQPAGKAPPRFAFIGEGLQALLGISPQALEADPTLPWRLMGQGDTSPPATAREFDVTHSGRHWWIRCECLCTTHADGSQTFNGYWSNITDRRQTDARTQAVFANVPLGFIFFDDQISITRVNPATVSLFGADNDRALLGLKPYAPPMTATSYTDLTSTIAVRNRVADELGKGQISHFDWQHTRFDGEVFECEVVAIPFEHGGQKQVCAILQDVTTRKQTEAATHAAQQAAEQATLAKSRFLANMSHEIRTPMNAIMGMTHLALIDELPPKARNYIDKAHRAATNLLQILNDVLDVSKIESGRLELERTEFQLETVIGHMADVVGMRAEDKGLELLFTAPPDIPTDLIGDPTRLGQILINLGTNAVKFTEKGEVVIGCEVQRLDPEDVLLHFWVSDTGSGLPPDQVERLFEPFTQGDNSTTRQHGGTGLGLAIARQLVEMMHGHIWVHSQPGKGATFHFTARFGMQAQPAARRALMASELQGKRVLLVDDNATAREIMGDMARRLGLDVELSDSGEHALEAMRAASQAGRPHHVLLTDWKMPGMDGITFARHALSMPPEQRPCVLLVTAFARDEAIKAAQGVGLAGVINKPITSSTLLDTLSRVLGQDHAAPPTPRATGKLLHQAHRQLAGARVLLVEDQPLNQELACDLLERAGLSVVTAYNGQEALNKLERGGRFDGVLMDCQMPVMDGYTATRRIRQRPEWAHLPIIAMTASAMAGDRQRVLDAGMNDHITKPLDLAQMFTIMSRWIKPGVVATQPGALTEPTPALPALGSLDTPDGLARCMGNLALYQRLLKGFAKTQCDFATHFADAGTNTEEAARLTHDLKGLAGNIGARTLFERCVELETTITQTKDPLAPAVQLALQATVVALQAVLADVARLNQGGARSAEPDLLAPDVAEQPQWGRLAQLINDNDADARDLLDDLLGAQPELARHPQAASLKRALERYDFDAAARALKVLSA
jgi:two-component system sensor histidine kinase/response regulator